MFKPILLSAFISFYLTSSVMAATVIEIQDNDAVTTMMTDGNRARVNMADDEFVIVDFASKAVNVITPSQKQITAFNAGSLENASGNGSAVDLSLRPMGDGGSVAGYQTQKYQYSANGRSCGVVYASQNAYQEKGVKELLQVMQVMIEQQRAMLGGFASLVDDCTLAEMQLTDKVNTIGVPMRTETGGRVGIQVTSIRFDVVLPGDAFIIPENFEISGSSGENRTGNNSPNQRPLPQSQPKSPPKSQQAQRPSMHDASGQMPVSGQLAPEIINQMRRVPNRMHRYQRPSY